MSSMVGYLSRNLPSAGSLWPNYGKNLGGAHLPSTCAVIGAMERAAIEKIILEYEAALPAGAWPNWVLATTTVRGRQPGRTEQARPAMLLLTLRGTPTLYTATRSACIRWRLPPKGARSL